MNKNKIHCVKVKSTSKKKRELFVIMQCLRAFIYSIQLEINKKTEGKTRDLSECVYLSNL